MPKLNLKDIQIQLKNDELWPVYWFHGPENYLVRVCINSIKTVFESHGVKTSEKENVEVLEASEVSAARVLESAQSLSFFGAGGPRFIIIKDAHLLKEPELLDDLMEKRDKWSDLKWVCAFISKDLDQRRKFSKTIAEKAAVISCESVSEREREGWVLRLSKKYKLDLTPEIVIGLCAIEPWSLDIIDQELCKYMLANNSSDPKSNESESILIGHLGPSGGTDVFVEAFFLKKIKTALPFAKVLADRPQDALPCLGLLGWNVRELLLFKTKSKGIGGAGVSFYSSRRFERWEKFWTVSELLNLQKALSDIDFSLKQKPIPAISLWTDLIVRFAKP